MIMENKMMDLPDDSASAPVGTSAAGIVTQAPGDFKTLMASAQLSHQGFSPNPALARLQLSQRLQTKFGPDYGSNDQAKAILSAYDIMKPQAMDPMDANQQSAQAGRTLGALIGKP